MTWQEAIRVLEIPNPKNLQDVREAYNIQVKAWHPDRFEGDAKMQRIGTAKMKLINEAFKFLKENWDRRGYHQDLLEFPRAVEPVSHSKMGPRDLVTVLEHGTATAERTHIVVGAKRVREYLGDAVIIVTIPDHRSREIRLKVGEAITVEFGRSMKFEIRLLQVRQVYRSRRGLPFPLFYPAADLAVTRLATGDALSD
jgi:curved DNA-binding protein CbpA